MPNYFIQAQVSKSGKTKCEKLCFNIKATPFEIADKSGLVKRIVKEKMLPITSKFSNVQIWKITESGHEKVNDPDCYVEEVENA